VESKAKGVSSYCCFYSPAKKGIFQMNNEGKICLQIMKKITFPTVFNSACKKKLSKKLLDFKNQNKMGN
jgi:hypothetical protein